MDVADQNLQRGPDTVTRRLLTAVLLAAAAAVAWWTVDRIADLSDL